MKISILLPFKENFSPSYAGAVSLFINDTLKFSKFRTNITVYGFTDYKKKFKNMVFLSFEQNKNKDIAKLLNIDYWTTIIVYKNSKEVAKEIGVTSKSDIYSLIKKEI